MPQRKKGPALGSDPKHQRLMLQNLARSLFEHEKVKTTETKAKLLRPYAEHLITKAKKGSIHDRRQVLSVIGDRDVVHKLFADIGPRFSERNGGYTRVLKLGSRAGDGAEMAIIELVEEAGGAAAGTTEETSTARKRRLRRPARRRGAAAEGDAAEGDAGEATETDAESDAGTDAESDAEVAADDDESPAEEGDESSAS